MKYVSSLTYSWNEPVRSLFSYSVDTWITIADKYQFIQNHLDAISKSEHPIIC